MSDAAGGSQVRNKLLERAALFNDTKEIADAVSKIAYESGEDYWLHEAVASLLGMHKLINQMKKHIK